MKNTIVVNLFGGPGIAKSTTAAGVFSLLKMHDVDCEYVPEFAKDLVWEKRDQSLKNQIYIFSKQYHRMWRVNGQVDVIVTDSPLLFTLIYANATDGKSFKKMAVEEFNSFNNLNFLLYRTKPYNPNGRYQDEDQARNLDITIEKMLIEQKQSYNTIAGDFSAPNVITKHVLDKFMIKTKYGFAAI